MTDAAQWPAPWVRAALDLAVLASLTDGPLHGYAIGQSLAADGFGLLKGGSLYPVLGRLEEAGDVEASWVEGRAGPGAGSTSSRQAAANGSTTTSPRGASSPRR